MLLCLCNSNSSLNMLADVDAPASDPLLSAHPSVQVYRHEADKNNHLLK